MSEKREALEEMFAAMDNAPLRPEPSPLDDPAWRRIFLGPEQVYASEYMGTFVEDDAMSKAVQLWRHYYAQCEAYDRTVCTGPIGRDGILPATTHETGLIEAHARKQHAATMQAATEAGISGDVMRRARDIALRSR